MAANEETVCIDTVKKTLWDSLEALGENISGETLSALMEIIEGGGSKTVIIPFDVEDNTFTTESTVAQIHEADDETALVFARFPMESGYAKMPLIYSDEETVIFSGISYGNDVVSQNVLLGHTDDELDAWQFIAEPSGE